MLSYIIEGGGKLEGETYVSGSKNASLPIIAASILHKGTTKLYNVPNIHDTQKMFEILKKLGCKIKKNNDKIIIDSTEIISEEIPDELMRQMRSSVIIVGAILGRRKRAKFSYPGGCDIGARPIDLHLKAFKELGTNIREEAGFITCEIDKITPTNIHLDFPSVGATENIMLLSVLAEGKTEISNAAMEPEIVDLANFLNRMGAKVYGAGSNIIKIIGVKRLKDTSYCIMPDRIEAGTILSAVAQSGGKVLLKKVLPEHLTSVLHKLEESGCQILTEKNTILLSAPKKLKSIQIKTMPYPGFPTDMQSVFASMLTTAKGTSLIIENIFENRYKYVNELRKMGAKMTVEGKICVIKGTKRLYGANISATDLRGGASLIVAGLNAKGKTQIDNAKYILRGYENLDKKLNNLGANIKLKNI